MSFAIITEESIACGQMDEVVFSTGMGVHMFNDEKWFSSLDRSPHTYETSFGEGKSSGKGTVRLPLKSATGEVVYWTLKDCMFVPKYINVLSAGRVIDDMEFTFCECEISLGRYIYHYRTNEEDPTTTLKFGQGYGGVPILPVILSRLGEPAEE